MAHLVEQLGKYLVIVCDVRDGDVLAAEVRRIQVCVARLDGGLGLVRSDAVSRVDLHVRVRVSFFSCRTARVRQLFSWT